MGNVVVIPASTQGIETSWQVFGYLGMCCWVTFRTQLLRGHCNSHLGPTDACFHHFAKCFPRWQVRAPGKEESSDKLCLGDLPHFTQHLLSSSKSRIPFLMNGAAALALRANSQSELLTVHCSACNFCNNTGCVYQPHFSPTAQIYLQGKSTLYAKAAGIKAYLWTDFSRILSLAMSRADTSYWLFWSCKNSACHQLGLQFSGSSELRKSKQEIKHESSDPLFCIISHEQKFCFNALTLRSHTRYITVELDINHSLSLCSEQKRKRQFQLLSKS